MPVRMYVYTSSSQYPVQSRHSHGTIQVKTVCAKSAPGTYVHVHETVTLFLSSSLFHCLANSCSVCASLTDGKGFIAQKRRPESVGTSRDTDLEAASTHRNMLSSAMVSKVRASAAVGHCILFDSCHPMGLESCASECLYNVAIVSN